MPKRSWSQQQPAKTIGTSGPIVGRYKRGEMVPSVEVAKKLAETFDDTGFSGGRHRPECKHQMEIEALDSEDKKPLCTCSTLC